MRITNHFHKILYRLLLEEHGVPYRLTEHESVRTSEDAARVRGVALKTGAKAMVVRAKDDYYLLVMPADKRIDWKRMRALLRVSSLRLATEEEAESIAHVKMGSVPPFGNVLGLPTYFDEALFENEVVNFNPGSTTHSIALRSADLRALVSPTVTSFAI